jgi:hypothetical protein
MSGVFGGPNKGEQGEKGALGIAFPEIIDLSELESLDFIPKSFNILGSVPPMIMQDVPYNANDFSGNGAMTWTVEAGDIVSFRYGIQGKMLFVSLFIVTSSIAGVLDSTLQIKLPGGYIASKDTARIPCVLTDNATWGIGSCWIQVGQNLIKTTKIPISNFLNSVNTTIASFQIWIEV